MKKINGLWLYGLSGSGKTYLSKKISLKIKNSFLIDGDIVRSLISFDLGYTVKDRIKQNQRVLGLAKIVIKNKMFPIISSVYLDPKVFKDAKKINLKVVNILTNKKSNINRKFIFRKNVVGKSIKQPKLNSEVYENSFKNKHTFKIYEKN